MTHEHLIARAMQCIGSDHLAEAENICRGLLAQDPNHVPALQILGIVAYRQGKTAHGIELLERALALAPDNPDAHGNIGVLLANSNRFDEAVAHYRRALALMPTLYGAQINLGLLLRRMGKLEEAAAEFRAVALQKPDYLDAHVYLGHAMLDMNRLDEAESAYRNVLKFEPDRADTLLHLGKTLTRKRNFGDAEIHVRRSLRVRPDQAEAYTILGVIAREQNRLDEAIAHFRRAVELHPQHPDRHFDLGFTLQQAQSYEAALECFRRAVAINPNHAIYQTNLGATLIGLKRMTDGIAAYRRALEIDPNLAATHSNLSIALHAVADFGGALAHARRSVELAPDVAEIQSNLGFCLLESHQIEPAIGHFEKAIQLAPNFPAPWNNLGNAFKDMGRMQEALAYFKKAAERSNDSAIHSNYVYSLHYADGHSLQEIFQAHLDWAARHAEPLRQSIQPHANDRNPDRPLRVGYVSPNFKDQVINFCLEPALRAHDRSQFQIYLYSDVVHADDITARLKSIGHPWRDTASLKDEQFAQLVRDDRIDILVDLSGHIAFNRMLLFARKPAPLQVTYLGYQDTTGMTAMDYLITDEHTCPSDANENLYTEKLIRLPGCFWCYLPQATPDVSPSPAAKNGFVTFAYLNNFAKLTPAMMKVWCEALRQTPKSKFLVLTREPIHSRAYLQGLLRENDVDPARLIVEGPRPKPQYFELFQRVDIAFDPFPFNGHTTTHDCLWMGVPVVHLSGNTYASRYGGSVLKAAGLDPWITTTPDACAKLAMDLARDIDGLVQHRRQLRQRVLDSILVDAGRFTPNLEAAYRSMWQSNS